MRISDWSSDVCSSDLEHVGPDFQIGALDVEALAAAGLEQSHRDQVDRQTQRRDHQHAGGGHRWRLAEAADRLPKDVAGNQEQQAAVANRAERFHAGIAVGTFGIRWTPAHAHGDQRSEAPTSELHTLMRLTYARSC